MVTQARGPLGGVAAAQSASVIVLPAPGGPVTMVMGPRAPRAMSLSSLGRATSQPGTPGTGILDARSGSPVPVACRAEPPAAGAAALVIIGITFSSAGPPVTRARTRSTYAASPSAISDFARKRVIRHHP